MVHPIKIIIYMYSRTSQTNTLLYFDGVFGTSFKVAMKALLYFNACKSKLCIKIANPRSVVDANI